MQAGLEARDRSVRMNGAEMKARLGVGAGGQLAADPDPVFRMDARHECLEGAVKAASRYPQEAFEATWTNDQAAGEVEFPQGESITVFK